MNRQKVAMITGGTGMDGSHLADFLITKGYYVVSLKRRTSMINTKRIDHLYGNPNFKLEYFDLNDVSSMFRLLLKYQPNEIYMLAAQSHVHTSFLLSENTVDGIAMGTLRMLNVIKEVTPLAKVYNSATSELFGINEIMPLNENSRMIPASPYACAKLFSYSICNNYRDAYNLHISNGILFNHSSERRGETFFERKLTIAAARIKEGLADELTLGNLAAKRDLGSAREYVECMWKMLQQETPDNYVIATGKTYSAQDMCDFVFDYAGLGDSSRYVRIDERYFRPQEVPILLGDPTKAKTQLGWEAKTDIFDLLRMMYDHDLKIVKQEKQQGAAKWPITKTP